MARKRSSVRLLLDTFAVVHQLHGVPDCRLCDFRKAQRQRLRRGEIDLTSPEVRAQFATYPGFTIIVTMSIYR